MLKIILSYILMVLSHKFLKNLWRIKKGYGVKKITEICMGKGWGGGLLLKKISGQEGGVIYDWGNAGRGENPCHDCQGGGVLDFFDNSFQAFCHLKMVKPSFVSQVN